MRGLWFHVQPDLYSEILFKTKSNQPLNQLNKEQQQQNHRLPSKRRFGLSCYALADVGFSYGALEKLSLNKMKWKQSVEMDLNVSVKRKIRIT